LAERISRNYSVKHKYAMTGLACVGREGKASNVEVLTELERGVNSFPIIEAAGLHLGAGTMVLGGTLS
jgi:hypothetical protein